MEEKNGIGEPKGFKGTLLKTSWIKMSAQVTEMIGMTTRIIKTHKSQLTITFTLKHTNKTSTSVQYIISLYATIQVNRDKTPSYTKYVLIA